jgi:hypothetical protein
MKQYLVFYGEQCYPSGGWGDFRLDCDSVTEAKDFLLGESWDWAQVVDSKTGDIVYDQAKT